MQKFSYLTCKTWAIASILVMSAGAIAVAQCEPLQTSAQTSVDTLELVKTQADLTRLTERRVRVVGRYRARVSVPTMTGIPGWKGVYIKATIVLEDGTMIAIFPPWNKRSLRSPQEQRSFDQQMVEAIGRIEVEDDRSLNPNQQTALVTLESLKLSEP
jgi:hypothetical protein